MQALLEHEGFVRSVVRNLLRDDASVQDVMQETWVRALEKPPAIQQGRAGARAWLARVATNVVHSSHRSKRARKRREERVAPHESDTSWQMAMERVEARQRIVQAVLALPEPYREVVLLRYEDDLSAVEIGKRLERSASTVRSQLSRGHEILRGQLDQEFGDRKTWAVLALPAGSDGIPTDAPTASLESTGVTKAATKAAAKAATQSVGSPTAWWVPVAALAVIAGGAWVWSNQSPEGEIQGLSAQENSPIAEAKATLQPIGPSAGERTTTPEAAVTEKEPDLTLWSGPPPETLLPRAELMSHSKHRSNEAATFSFEHGLRDDPRGITGNDWEIQFSRDSFDVSMVTDDRGIIVDLGQVHLQDVHPGLLDLAKSAEEVPAQLGHSYVVWTRDRETDLVSAFEVVEHVQNDRCVLDWYTVNSQGQASGSYQDAGTGVPLAATLRAIRERFSDANPLPAPRVLLQARVGHVGGNPCEINMLGEYNAYFDGASEGPIDLHKPLESQSKTLGYAKGGNIPRGKKFVIRRVSFWALESGLANGRGEFAIDIGGQSIVSKDYARDGSRQVWTGEVDLYPGQESRVTLTISYFTQGEALIEGELVAAEREEDNGVLLANGMVLFRKAEIPGSLGFSFLSGEVSAPQDRRSQAEIVFWGGRLHWGRGEFHDLGKGTLSDSTGLDSPGQILEKTDTMEAGRCYLYESPRGSTTIFRVDQLDAGKICVLDWWSQNRLGQVSGSFADPDGQLERFVNELRRTIRKGKELTQPFVQMQVRLGSAGGNTCKVNMLGESRRLDQSQEPLDLATVLTDNERNAFFCRGGLIPLGQVFVVSRVEYSLRKNGAADGKKCPVRIRLGSVDIVREKDLQQDRTQIWNGRVVLQPGQEPTVRLEATYGLTMEAKFIGEFRAATKTE